MKKWLVGVGAILMSASLGAAAPGVKLGAHGAYTTGGDIEDEDMGWGGQLAFAGETTSIEFSGTKFSIEEVDVTSLALSLRLGAEVANNLGLYVGGGGSYNMFDADTESEDVLEPDNEGGWHLCGGLTIDLGKHLEVFAEYRYSWIKFTVDTDEWDFEKVDEDWTYGLARVGLNLVL